MSEKSPLTVPAYVGIDLSLTGTGITMKRDTELIMKTIRTTPKSAPNDLERLKLICRKVMEFIPQDTVMICMEDFFIPGRASQINAAKGLIMAGTLTRVALLDAGYPFYIVAPSQLKKYATGKGNGPKGIVIREIYKRWGVDAKDDNQADSCVLAHMAEAIHRQPDFNLHQYQQDTIDKIIKERPHYNV